MGLWIVDLRMRAIVNRITEGGILSNIFASSPIQLHTNDYLVSIKINSIVKICTLKYPIQVHN